MSDKFTTTRGDVTQVAASPKRPQSENSGSVYGIFIYLFGMPDALTFFVHGMTRMASIRGDFDAKKSVSYIFTSRFGGGTIGLSWANVAALRCHHIQNYQASQDDSFLYMDKSDANSA